MAHVVKSHTKSSDKNRWATTWEAFADAQYLYGRPFELDVCAEPATTKCKRYFVSPEYFEQSGKNSDELFRLGVVGVDALAAKSVWPNHWFCNPPFDNKEAFILAAISASDRGHPGMMMLPYEPLTQWWQNLVDGNAAKIYEPNGRYNFYESDGVTKKTGVNFGCAFVLFDHGQRTTPRVKFKRGIGIASK
ncbi:DNA N-6-adenine-methyltransferase [Photobacterium leiognathi]|uniref:DNA N-6-adenine-methyltransferase n=1 Tax=Photobacterium leiognathi TaxID=553611 RepID=UPI002981AFEF|nr:DNA N-6-adenine-methyltransferase [Photobacterium leiognathi]